MRLIFPLILGLAGAAVLVSLGIWQLGRAAEKDATLAAIEARLTEAPVDLPPAPRSPADLYLPVAVEGVVDGPAIAVFDTWRGFGAGVRAVVPLRVGAASIPLDLGVRSWAPGTDPAAAAQDAPPPGTVLRVEGNLDWPEDGRAALSTPVLVAREVTPATAFTPIPVSAEGIPDNHMGYAIQWFGLALVWVGMTLYWVWRIRRRTS
ncbi:SURF1 family protein [Jannaschia sp. Os4]|uniref:SURF1 family protein n=1 Tax=Jannaschia sp. Os4 TaxID=2807617 RepID=UPI00193958CF|nr:SURF1 family protein [Jannaschia sp. Os4]MBM2574942.1 SURF1 family protein [Jannaschia sp. Os4]